MIHKPSIYSHNDLIRLQDRDLQNKQQHGYRVCYYSSLKNEWLKLEQPITVYVTTKQNNHKPLCPAFRLNNNNEVEIQFSYLFKDDTEHVKFAMSYPYEYKRCVDWVDSLYKQYYDDDMIQFDKEIMIRTPESRSVYLLSVTKKKQIVPGKPQEREAKFDPLLFEDESNPPRPLKDKKPVILISARVHPGETPSSYACQGILKFLLNKQDLRSQMLLKFFTFKIVPMLNPDGVYHGHYRMDIFGQNLNRYYTTGTNSEKQPAIYALKTLIEQYSKENRLLFYFDLHAHPARKGCFIYGNALSDFVSQVQNYLFCKLMAMNTKYFEFACCNFSKKHMKLKDRFQELTKQGCGRVFAYRCSSMVHSFTLQLGYHFTNNLNELPDISNPQFTASFDKSQTRLGYNCVNQPVQDKNYMNSTSFYNVGEALMVSVLDSFQKNPYSRIYSSEFCTLQNMRRTTAFEVFHEEQRFRMFELHTYSKVKHINELIDESFYSKYSRLVSLKECFPDILDWPSELKKNMYNSAVGATPANNGIVGITQMLSSEKERQFLQKIQLQEYTSEKITLPQGNFRSSKHCSSVRSNHHQNRRFSLKAKSSSAKKQDTEKEEDILGIDSGDSSDEDEEVLTGSEISSPRKKHVSSGLANFSFANESLLYDTSKPVRAINLTFQQNILVLPAVNTRSPESHSIQLSTANSAKSENGSRNNINNSVTNFITSSETTIEPGGQSLKEELLKQFENFKKQFKEEFSKVIKSEVADQINKNSFVRNYLKNKRSAELSKWRKNKFMAITEKQLTVQSIKPEEKTRLSVRLPSLGK